MSALPPPSTGESNVTQTYFESLPDLGYEPFLIDTGVRSSAKMPGALSAYNLVRFFRHFHLLVKDCLEFRPAVINLMFASTSILKFASFAWISNLMGILVIGQMHSAAIDSIYEASSRIQKKYLRFVFSLPFAWIVLGEYWHEFMLRVGIRPERLCIIPNAVKGNFEKVATDRSRPEETDPPIILFVGAVGMRKGMDVLLAALVDLQRKDVRFQAIIVGGTYFPGDLERFESEFHDRLRPGSFEFVGPQENEELIARLLQSSVFVLPSRAENLPVALLEAMACGTAVIATAVGSVPDVIQDWENGVLVPPNDSEALSEAMAALLADGQLRNRLGENAQKTIIAHHLARGAGEKMDRFIRALEERV